MHINYSRYHKNVFNIRNIMIFVIDCFGQNDQAYLIARMKIVHKSSSIIPKLLNKRCLLFNFEHTSFTQKNGDFPYFLLSLLSHCFGQNDQAYLIARMKIVHKSSPIIPKSLNKTCLLFNFEHTSFIHNNKHF